MASGDPRVPELLAGVDIRSLPLSAIDGFVFSRIDGHATVSEIVAMTGLPAEQVAQILDKLVQLGAVQLRAPAPQPSQPAARATSLPPGVGSQPPRRRPPSGPAQRRMFSESSISSPPPEMRSGAPRPRSSTPAQSRTPVPPGPGRAPTGSAATTSRVPPARPLPAPAAREQAASPRAPGPAAPAAPAAPAVFGPSASDSSRSPTAPPPEPAHTPTSSQPAELYDPRELEEEVDLPRGRRKQILDLYYRYKQLDYYAILGVAPSAERKEIRAAYFALSKAFHPDSMFRKELGSYKAKMTQVFQALTEAYETLSRPKSRAEYDAYRRSTRSIHEVERALAQEPAAPPPSSELDVPRPPPLPSATEYELPPPSPLPQAPRAISPEERRRARELLERRLRGAQPAQPAGRRVGPGDATRGQTEAAGAPDRQLLARDLTRSLIDARKVTGSADQVARALLEARAAFERGQLGDAVQHMARAIALAPERTDLHAEHGRLARMLAQQLADNYAEQARFEAKQGHWAAAAVSWSKVCEGRPDDPQAHRFSAYALLKAGVDLRSALKHAQRAVFLAPSDVELRILLAQAYLTVGLKLNARRELDAAAKLDPENEMVKNLLSELKG